MGWFSNAIKNLRPDRVMKDPKKMMQMQLDPAGSIVRSGRGEEMKGKWKSFIDPGGFKEEISPKMPEVPVIPAPPRINDAQVARQNSDRSRRRRGVFANLFSNSGSGGTTLG